MRPGHQDRNTPNRAKEPMHAELRGEHHQAHKFTPAMASDTKPDGWCRRGCPRTLRSVAAPAGSPYGAGSRRHLDERSRVVHRRRRAFASLSFPKIRSGRIRAVRENQTIIQCDCDHLPAWNTIDMHESDFSEATGSGGRTDMIFGKDRSSRRSSEVFPSESDQDSSDKGQDRKHDSQVNQKGSKLLVSHAAPERMTKVGSWV
jgi:hypothetical protein